MPKPSKSLVDSWSYSRYADYKQCPLKFKLKHIDKRKEPGSPAMQRGNDIHHVAENYVQIDPKVKVALPPELVGVQREADYLRGQDAIVEVAWGFTREWTWIGRAGWFGSDVWLRAKADAHVVYDDDTMLLVDWKSGKKYDTNEEQVELFALAGFMRYPNVVEVDTRLWYTDAKPDDNEVQRVYTRSDAGRIQKDWERKTTPMFNDRKFAPTPNDRCRWCHFRASNGGPCRF